MSGAVLARLRGDRGQSLAVMLAAAFVVIAIAAVVVAIASAITAKGRSQRAVDLAAVSAARSMRDDHARLFVPAYFEDGTLNPDHLERSVYLARAQAAAREALAKNSDGHLDAQVDFPDGESFAPIRVTVRVVLHDQGGQEVGDVEAEAIAAPAPAAAPTEAIASGSGDYSGPLVYRQGKPMRPDVAEAFDRLAAAAAADRVPIQINSAYRSDAEQAILFAANPDPRMVAPPGVSLHRCGTELDLGPNAAYGWLAANAGRFGFVQRYSWEPWHYGFSAGPAPCSAPVVQPVRSGAGHDSKRGGDGAASSSQGLPDFVPAAYRSAIAEAASRHGVAADLLAAQLMAESNFNPFAVSPVGAQGIAQFMPGTAAAYGLVDPFDAPAAIDAQARLMADLLAQFGRNDLALAAYNAGPGAVSACGCADPYPETASYVSRILGLIGSTTIAAPVPGVTPISALEVRLIG